MPSSPSAAADPSLAARPYGLLGLLVSLLVIAALAIVLLIVAMLLVLLGLIALHGLSGATTLLNTMLAEAKLGGSAAERLNVVLGIILYVAPALAILAVARFRGGHDWSALLAWRDWEPRLHWKLFAGLFAVCLLWEFGASAGIEHIYPESKDWIVVPKETGSIIGFLALAVLVGPFVEELLFRGWIYTSLRASFGLIAAIIATSVPFALAHWESSHLYALAVFPIGLALAFVRERTGSIAASITFHTLFNGVASVLLFAGK